MSILKRLLPSVLLSSSLVLAQGTINTYAGNDAIFAGAGQPGEWKIVTDESPSAFAPLIPQITSTAPAVRRPVLAQLSRDATDEHFPMLIYDGQTFKNFKLTMPFKIIGGVASDRCRGRR